MQDDLSMIQATLRRLRELGHITAADVAEATGRDESTFYRWTAPGGGGSDPTFTSIAQLFRHAPNTETQQAILDVLLRGTAWRASLIPVELDLDGDGDVDTDDAIKGCAAACKITGAAIEEILSAAPDGVSASEGDDILERIGQTEQQLSAARRIVESLVEASSRRRRCRPIAAPGNAGRTSGGGR